MSERIFDHETLKVAARQAKVDLEGFVNVYAEWLPKGDLRTLRKSIGILGALSD